MQTDEIRVEDGHWGPVGPADMDRLRTCADLIEAYLQRLDSGLDASAERGALLDKLRLSRWRERPDISETETLRRFAARARQLVPHIERLVAERQHTPNA